MTITIYDFSRHCAKEGDWSPALQYAGKILSRVQEIHPEATEGALFGPSKYVLAIEKLTGRSIKDLRILDLGCGASEVNSNTLRPRLDGDYKPWFCRAIHCLGGKIIGVDMGDLSQERFTAYNVDLSEPDSLKYILDQSIDVATAIAFFNSPSMPKRGFQTIKTNILNQLERIVVPEGFLLISSNLNQYVEQVFDERDIVGGNK